MSAQVHIHRSAELAASAAARRFIEIGSIAIERRGRFCAALSGGTTPIRMYEILAGSELSGNANHGGLRWESVHIFFADERCVPPDHADSNYALMRRCLLDRIDIPECHIHRIKGEWVPGELAANDYALMLREFFGAGDAGPPNAPTFDLVLLGVGEDGHVASLFPGSAALMEDRRWAMRTQAPEGVAQRDRITLTLPVINAARQVMFLVTGAKKLSIVRPLLAGSGDPRWPAAMVTCAGATEWHVDEAAAGSAE